MNIIMLNKNLESEANISYLLVTSYSWPHKLTGQFVDYKSHSKNLNINTMCKAYYYFL